MKTNSNMTDNREIKNTSFGIDLVSKFVYADEQVWFTFQNNQLVINEDGQIQTVEYLEVAFNDFKKDIYEYCPLQT